MVESPLAPPVWVGRGRCSEHLSETSAFVPLIESLQTLVGGESNRQAAQLLQTMAPSWFRHLSLTSGQFSPPPSADDKTVSHARMRREFVSFFEELSRARPVILFFDDLHWADASTCDLLAYFGPRARHARILILGAYRAASALTGQLPFMRLKIDLERHAAYQEMPVSLLNLADVERYLELRFSSNQFPVEFSRAVYQRTEGNPLFMTDLLRFLGDRQTLVQRGGSWLMTESVTEVSKLIPNGTHDMIQLKIGRLGDEQRRILLCAAVQGLEFDSAALAQVLSIDPVDLEERLQELDTAYAFVRLVNERDFPNRVLSVRYRFAHVFYQNALYSSLVPSRRAEYSLALAQALVALNGDNSQTIAADLAVLFESGRDFANASRYFLQAAHNAARLFAYPEAVLLCQRGMKALASLPDSRDRDSIELDFSLLLGLALMPFRGYGSPETGDAHRRTRDLCVKLEDYGRLLPALWGLHLCEVNAGRLVSSLSVAQEMRQAAEKLADRFALGASLHAMGTSLAYIGRLSEARQSLEPIVANYPLHLHVFPGPLFVMDPIVTTLTTLSRVLAYLGYLDQAVDKAAAAVELAQRLAHAPSVVFAKFRLGWLRYWRGEYQECCTHLDFAIALGREHGISPAWARLIRGAAWSRMGRAEEGIVEIRAGIAAHDAAGSMLERPYCLTLLAEALSAKGATQEALDLCNRALEIGRATEGRCYQPETLRLRGEILLSSGEDSVRDEAAALFQSAIQLARTTGSRVLELRATVSSHNLHRGSPAGASSRAVLVEVLDWFKEGTASPILTHARGVVDL